MKKIIVIIAGIVTVAVLFVGALPAMANVINCYSPVSLLKDFVIIASLEYK